MTSNKSFSNLRKIILENDDDEYTDVESSFSEMMVEQKYVKKARQAIRGEMKSMKNGRHNKPLKKRRVTKYEKEDESL